MPKPNPKSRGPAGGRPRPEAGRAAPRPSLRFDPTPRLAAAVFAVLVVLFFHQVALEGKTFVAPDTTAPAGFVRVGEQALFRDHVYPLWNPYVFLGMPSFASGAYNPLIYPPDWPLALIQRVIHLPDMTWLLLYYFLGAWFLYLLAREWGARGEGALLAGAAFVFMPNLVAVGSHGHGSQLVDSAYIPLVLWLTARWLKRGRLHHLGWLALAGGFQMLRGHAQIVFYTWLAVGLYLIVDLIAGLRARDAVPLRLRLGRAAGVLAAMGLAFGLAGFYNLPLRDYARYSIRGGGAGGGVGVEYATSWSMAPWELPSILVPGAVGFGGATYWGAMPFTDYPNAYVGIVAAVLAVPAFLNRGVPRLFAILLAAVALLISFGKHLPLYGFLYDHLPLFNKFRVPVMILVLFQLSAALAVAWGWSRALDEAERPEARRGATGRVMLGTGAILALVLVLGVLGQQAWHEAYLRALHAHRSELPVGIAEQIFAQCVADLGRVVLLGLLAAGVVLLAARRRLSPPLGTLVALGLVLVDLWPISGRVMAPVIGDRTQNDLDRGRDDVVQFLEKAGPPSTFRVLPLDVDGFQSNQFATFGIASVGGYHAAKPRLFQDYYDAKMVDNVRWMRLLNVRYVILDNPLDSPFQPIFRGSRVVYQIPALPRATVVGAYRVVSPAKAIIDSVGLSSENGARMAWLEKDPGLRLGPVDGARADITRYGLNDVTIDVTTPGPGLLRLADLWFPGWLATVDGRAVEILKADFLLRAVAVPAGRHRVEFHYRPPAVRQGLTLSLVSLVLVLALLGLPRLLRTRPRPAAGEAA